MEGVYHSFYLLIVLATYVTLAYSGDPLMYEVKDLGGSLVINCTEKEIPDTALHHWVLNDLTVLKENNEKFTIESNGWLHMLYFKEVDENAIGDFFCVLNKTLSGGNNTFLYFKITLSRKDKSTWDQFRTQTIVGVVASLVTLVVLIGLCLVWRFRWRPEEQDIAVTGGYDPDRSYPQKVPPVPEKDQGFVNETFANSNPPERISIIEANTQF